MPKPRAKKKDVDLTQLKALMRLKPTKEDTASFFEVSEDTIDRVIKKNFQVSFAVFRQQKMVHTRFAIIRKAIQKAEAGDNTMLIFCLKNLCGWKDRFEEDKTTVNVTTVTQLSDEEIDQRIEKLKDKEKNK